MKYLLNKGRLHLCAWAGLLTLPWVAFEAPLAHAAAQQAVPPPPRSAVADSKCEILTGHVFGRAKVTEAKLQPPSAGDAGICIVVAEHLDRPHLKMRAFLPARWDGVSLHLGGAGLDGFFLPPQVSFSPYQPTDRGIAVIQSNGGHEFAGGGAASMEGNREARIDYAYRAVYETDLFGDAILRAYYQSSPRYRYFAGTSKGGYDALEAAARFPNLYDGILAVAPAPRVNGWLARIASYSTLPQVSGDTWHRVYAAYIATCDGLDGLRDGVVSNIAACKFDPADLPGLTEAERTAIKSVSSDLVLQDGTVVYRRMSNGPEAIMFGAMKSLGQEWTRHLIFNSNFDPASFSLERDWPLILQANGPYEMDVPATDVASFARKNKKLLIIMGTNDTALSLDDNVEYYEHVRHAAGSSQGNVRMYLLPGVGHGGNPFGESELQGPASIDVIGTLRAWAEAGQLPDKMIARSSDAKKAPISRPVCEVGSYPRYIGSGDASLATSFRCTRNGQPIGAHKVG